MEDSVASGDTSLSIAGEQARGEPRISDQRPRQTDDIEIATSCASTMPAMLQTASDRGRHACDLAHRTCERNEIGFAAGRSRAGRLRLRLQLTLTTLGISASRSSSRSG